MESPVLTSPRNQRGFTLIELLVVLFIIATLVGLLLPNLMSARQRGRDARRKQDLEAIKNALRLYYNDHQQYPSPEDFSFGSEWKDERGNYYMRKVPQDPLGDTHTYGYCVSSDGDEFRLWADLENSGDPDIADSKAHCPPLEVETCSDSCDSETQNCYYVCSE
ncbi:prepilin-type N-terminal cleavage/methylation domain-containing protein [bacterium]|nr:prepilin-type N-terminal cleavage/methylation domain-containing protein [bacterium]